MGINPTGTYLQWDDDTANLRCTVRFLFEDQRIHMIFENICTTEREELTIDPHFTPEVPEALVQRVFMAQPSYNEYNQ